MCDIWWRCGESNSGPNPSMKESLRRVVSVSVKAGCEERRRNHSCPIPYLDASVGSPRIDPTDNSTHLSRCRNRREMNVARRWSLDLREREREVTHTEVRGLHACKSVLGKFGFPPVLSGSGRALRRTSFKVQTVKAGHPRKIQKAVYRRQYAGIPSELFGTTDSSARARSLVRHRASSGPHDGRPYPCRGRWRCAPSRTSC